MCIIVWLFHPNKMYMSNKREYSLKANKEQRLERLISEFNQQLKISSTTQNNFNS